MNRPQSDLIGDLDRQPSTGACEQAHRCHASV